MAVTVHAKHAGKLLGGWGLSYLVNVSQLRIRLRELFSIDSKFNLDFNGFTLNPCQSLVQKAINLVRREANGVL